MPVEMLLDGRGVATVTVEGEKLNLIDSTLMRALTETLSAGGGDQRLRAVVLTGAGTRAFIGGADIREMAQLTPETARDFITRLHGVCAAIRDLPVPVIARIDGYCLGAGLEVAAACDLRVASSRAVFGMPEVRVGIPSVIEAALLPALVGWGRARELVLTGDTIDAARALDWRLVEKVVPPDALDGAMEAWLCSILAGGREALRLQKALVRKWEDLPMREAIAAGIDAFAEAWEGEEPRRMMRAFLDRPRG
jgi:enoyl-CoA hydratase/carnithine racemase